MVWSSLVGWSGGDGGYSRPAVGGGPDTTTGLVSYWLMNEGSGTTYADGVGSHNGTLTSSSMWSGDFVAFTLNNSGSVADHADFGISSTLTIFGWVNDPAPPAGGILISQWDSGIADRAWLVGNDAGAGTKLRIVLSDDGTFSSGHNKDYSSSPTLFDGTWHSWAFRFNAGVLDLFVDGVKDTSPTKSTDDAITTIKNSAAAIVCNSILSSGSPISSGTNSNMKKIRFYNNAKTDADIAAMHAIGP